ncbi:MAG: zinc ribbon domain-containing protein [Saprospiraceae bacterium]|nr:zinc ribbon domain-containing protein [Saprospiraceae bacterium]
MEKTHKFCQSCMMPLSQDPQGGGSNADGSKSTMYCSYCYKDGKFVDNMNVNEMREFVVNKLVEMKYPRFIAKFMTMGLPKLERWRQAVR